MKLLEALRAHANVSRSEFAASGTHSHNVTKGEVRERVLSNFLRPILPECYGIGRGEVFSSNGGNSRQIDIVIYDAVFSIILRHDEEHLLLPCESVYGSVEVKSSLYSTDLEQAIENVRSLKTLERVSSDGLDFTPISRLNVGASLTYDQTIRNPYLGFVFALDGMDAERVAGRLIDTDAEYRSTLPDYVFNLKKGYMVSRWRWSETSGKPDIDCRVGEFNGFLTVSLGEDVLPIFYLTLNTVLNRTRLRQPDIGKIWIDAINEHAAGYNRSCWKNS